MISDHTPVVVLATADLPRARKFYEETLGLAVEKDEVMGVTYRCGSGNVFLYESQYAGTNKATAAFFPVPAEAFDAEVEALRGKGVSFMTFDFPGLEWEQDVAVAEGMRSIWFADPDGNILNLATM